MCIFVICTCHAFAREEYVLSSTQITVTVFAVLHGRPWWRPIYSHMVQMSCSQRLASDRLSTAMARALFNITAVPCFSAFLFVTKCACPALPPRALYPFFAFLFAFVCSRLPILCILTLER